MKAITIHDSIAHLTCLSIYRMLPEANIYGAWPASGEIDIMEAKGNHWQYKGGRNLVSRC